MILPPLNQSQQAAVNAPTDGPLLIIAGAGSGKTTALTARLLTLLNRGVNPAHIIAITFTNRAADEMRHRLSVAVPASLFIGTFHSFGARWLRRLAPRASRTAAFSIYDSDDSRRLFRLALKNLSLGQTRLSPAGLAARLSRAKNSLTDWSSLADSPSADDRLVAAVFTEYERLLITHNAFDFDDLLLIPVRLLSVDPRLLASARRRWRYLLVDEYQDVNPVQYALVRLLVGAAGNLNVVGDDQQAIYGFRGADFRNFLNFDRDFPAACVVKLEENYRSTKNIIAAANALIAHNERQRPKSLFTNNNAGPPVRVIEHEHEVAEAVWLARSLTQSSLASTAILYRTNAQSRPLEQSLIEASLPYEIWGGLRFYDRREIKDLVAALRFALNPHDQISLDRLSKNFYRHSFHFLKSELPRQTNLPPASLLRFILDTTDYLKQLSRQTANIEERAANIDELISFAAGFSDLASFAERLSLLETSEAGLRRRSRDTAAVNLMTIHLAKGLEFMRVFIVGCSEGLLPHERSLGSAGELEEERRLLYVAMTRAKQELTLSFSGLPSRFLSEIPPSHADFSISAPLDDEERYISI